MDESTLRLTFPEAIAAIKSKVPFPSTSWKTYSGQLNDVVFSIAGITKVSLLADIQALIVKQLETGITVEGFKKNFNALIDKSGWNPANKGYRTELILQQNVRTSYSRGRWEQMRSPTIAKQRPYWEWRHRDSRVPRPHHLDQDGKVYPADAEVFKAIFPPPFGCKCTAHALSDRDLERLGLNVSEPPALHTIAEKGFDQGFSDLPKERDRLIAEAKKRLPSKFAALLDTNAAFAEDQPRMPKGTPKGGQFASKRAISTTHIVSSGSVTTEKLETIFDDLEDDDNRENIKKLKDFINASGLNAVVYVDGQTPMADQPPPAAPGSNGYTNKNLNSIVVMHDGEEFQPDATAIKQAVNRVIQNSDGSELSWSFSDELDDRSSKLVMTYLHEMGHQFHYRNHDASILDAPEGWKSFTEYGDGSDTEFAAEHFVPWVIAPKAYKKADPIGYQWIQGMVEDALK